MGISEPPLLQLGVFRLDLPQDEDVRVGVFPGLRNPSCLWQLDVERVDFLRADVPREERDTFWGQAAPLSNDGRRGE
jgi:hypothetical protein